MSKDKKKIITRAERQAKMAARNEKLNNHINKGVDSFVQDIYNDRKEARKGQHWATVGEATKDALLNADYDADTEFLKELEQAQEGYYAQLDAQYEEEERKILEAEDDVIEVEFKALPSRRSNRRTSLLTSSNPLLNGSNNIKSSNSASSNNKSVFDAGEMPE